MLVTAVFALIIPLVLSFLIFFFSIFFLVFITFLLHEIVPESLLSFSINLDWIGEETYNLILGSLVILSIYLIAIWFYARLFVTDLFFAVEKAPKTFTLIKRSCLLTKNSKLKIFGTITLSFLVVFPIWLSISILIEIFLDLTLIVLRDLAPNLLNILINNELYLGLFATGFWFLLVNLLVMPFWQSLKAVVFYQITRQDNWDLISNHR